MKGVISRKISLKFFITLGLISITIFFISILATIENFVEYEKSRFVTIPTMLISVSLYPIYCFLKRKQMVSEDLSTREQTNYLILVFVVVTALAAITFLCLLL